MLSSKEQSDRLSSLVQLDIDAVNAYDQAIEQISVSGIRERLIEYRGDHQRHIDTLSSVLRDMGATPPKGSKDLKGFFLQGFTAIRSATGTEGALKAMETNEKLTNRQYDDAQSWDLDPRVKEIVQMNYSDEKRHLDYIQRVLSEKPWK